MKPPKARAPRADEARILESLDIASAPIDVDPALVLASGLPGSGKSTFCRRLAAETGAIVLESDALRRLLFGRPTHLPEESKRLFRALHGAARILLRSGVSVIIDATNLRQSDRVMAQEIAAETGARLLVLRFVAPESVIEQRLERRLRQPFAGDNSTAGIEVYRRLLETAEPPSQAHCTIDTSDAEATEGAFRSIVAVLKAGASRPESGIRSRDLVGVAARPDGPAGRGGTVS